MECPNCRYSEQDAALECSRCGLVFAKWRAASPGVFLAPKQEAGWSVWVWVTLLVAAAGVWHLDRSGGEDGSSGWARTFSGKKKVAADAPASKQSWHFEGHVFDLLRDAPIKGVSVSFLDFETGNLYEGVADDEGYYTVDVDVRWKMGYGVILRHSLYGERYWPVSAMKAPRPDRLRMGLQPPSTDTDINTYRGSRKKGPINFDFALFPRDLSDSERREAGL